MYYTFKKGRYVMASFIITGNKPLAGEIFVGGSKNAVLPIIFACLAVRGISVIENVPDITDVDTALSIIKDFGAKITRNDATLTVDTAELEYKPPRVALTSRIRASTYLLGASLARFNMADLTDFGGCNFQARPIDLHLYAFSCLGAELTDKALVLTKTSSGDIRFSKPSVGATANALILSAAVPTVTKIYGYAKEPHIFTLAEFLSSAGAKITFFDDFILVSGTRLSAARVVIPPDQIECGTYALASLITGGAVKIINPPKDGFSSCLSPILNSGVSLDSKDGSLLLTGRTSTSVKVTAAPYPAFPTDLQPPIAAYLGAASGGEIVDTVFPERFGYLSELNKFGLVSEYKYGKAVIHPSVYRPAVVHAPDLRGGAALVLAALCADGISVINNADTVLRGYGKITEKLRSLGADITQID